MSSEYLQECHGPHCRTGKGGKRARLPFARMVLASNHMYMCNPCADDYERYAAVTDRQFDRSTGNSSLYS